MQTLSSEYWNKRYQNNEIQWDLGKVSTPLKAYIDQLGDKSIKILIPGAGNGYEAEYLFKKGFENVYVVDVSRIALKNLNRRVPGFPKEQLINSDFFEFQVKSGFDLILEQTFFCALKPKLRTDYVLKTYALLKKKAKIVGLMFDFPLTEKGPPFGGSIAEYEALFRPKFQIDKMEPCFNSDTSRQGKELFVMFTKN